MRIISGRNKGKRIVAPRNLPVRPTTDIAKEALFNILENRYFLDSKKILDLFSGTGNIAFEFASRGCEDVMVIDQNIHCCNFISKIAGELNYNILVKKMDCLDFLQETKQDFDIIFADPPYHFEYYKEMKDNILKNNLIRKDGCLIIEHDSSINFGKENVELRKYGSVHFSIFAN